METTVPRGRHTPDMGEISGFGGGYEKCCQDMLEAGVKWLDEHPDCDLKLSHYKNIYGLLNEESADAKALGEVVIDASREAPGKPAEATGAMHHTVMSRLFFIRTHGWDKYCAELRGEPNGNDETAS